MISIIIPIYNSEKVLSRCIESIREQTFSDFELLLINDGSTDNSAAICNQYEVKDKRIRVFNKENGGVSSARNLGMDNAKGEFIFFVDSDDTIKKETLQRLMNHAEYDVVIGGVEFCGLEQGELTLEERSYNSETVKELFKKSYKSLIFFTVWGKLLKKEIIKREGLYFDTKLKLGEDSLFFQNYLLYCKKFHCINAPLYNYAIGETNLYNKYQLDSKQTIDVLNKSMNVFEKLCKQFRFTDEEYKKYKIFHYFSAFKSYFVTNTKLNLHIYSEFKYVFASSYITYILDVRKSFCLSNKILYYLIKYKLDFVAFLFCIIRKKILQ